MSLFSSSRWLVGISAMLALPAAMANERVQVVTSFSILADMVENVGGEHVTVSSLVGPDGDAHVFSPSPGDARALAGADLVVFNGLLFEGWMERLIDSSDYSGPMVTATDGLSPRALQRIAMMSTVTMRMSIMTSMSMKSTATTSMPETTIAITIMAMTTLTLGRTCSRPRFTSPIFVMV